MKKLITCLVVCVMSGAVAAEIHHVPADFPTIQYAVDAALDGDEIIVAPGTYTSTADEVVDMQGKEVWLHSSGGAEVTIIDGEGTRRGIYCSNGETSNTIIQGFTITNGYANHGGGMYNDNSSPTLTNCTFTENSSDEYGGGMYCNGSSPTLTNCTFTNNSADDGGGMVNDNSSNPTLTYCSFTGNTAGYNGGGMYNEYNSSPTLTNCTFTENSSDEYGGGMRNLPDCSPTLTDTTVCGNTPDQIVGGWTDDGTNTIAETCPWNQGACCTNDNCIVSEQEDCGTFFGQWLGEGTTCEDNPCPTSCLGDVTGDGQVDVTDILVVISVWGACP